MQFELRNHPAQARHPITRRPLFDDNQRPVPLFPEMRAIYMDGYHVGYCHAQPGKPVALIRNVDNYVRDKIFEFVESQVGRVEVVTMPPPIEDDNEEEEEGVDK